MSPVTIAKIGLVLIGLLVWGYGVRADDDRFRWAGIIMALAAFILRFVGRKTPPATPPGRTP